MGENNRRIAIVGLGYVGLPVAIALAQKFPRTVGFDTDSTKVGRLQKNIDDSGEVLSAQLSESELTITDDSADLDGADFFIITVPTPIDVTKRPDLRLLISATETVAQYLSRGAIVVYESTVYPGVTEEICAPVLERVSGLAQGRDFKLGYSPERINPGDREHTLERVVKVVSGEDEESLDIIAGVYESVVKAGVHRASSIKVAEASKVIENIQRDLNIALMNELAVIFDRLGIDTSEVLAASGTKWNFLSFSPGLVGGHCIGVDPYYLTAKAEELGIIPEVILAGRRINDSMGEFVANRTVKALSRAGRNICNARVAILGLTFKEDVRDLRNSKVPDIVSELQEYGVYVIVHDPLASPTEARDHYDINLVSPDDLTDLDAVILAVPHEGLVDLAIRLVNCPTPVLIDVKAKIPTNELPPGVICWRL